MKFQKIKNVQQNQKEKDGHMQLCKKHQVAAMAAPLIIAAGTLSAHEIEFGHAHDGGGYTDEQTGTYVSTSDITDRLWDSRGQSDEDISARIEFLAKGADPRTAEERAQDQIYIKKYSDAIVIDTLFIGGIGYAGMKREDVLDALSPQLDASFDAESLTVSNGDDALSEFSTLEIAALTDETVDEDDRLMRVRTADDIRTAHANRLTGIFYNVQGSDFIRTENIDEDVAAAAAAGILQADITYNATNAYGAGGNVDLEPEKSVEQGLTEAGVELVAAYNRHGIVVDCAHSSNGVCIDIAENSTKPVIISHIGARTLMDITRNVTDEAILAVAKTDGVISIMFLGGFLNKDGDASPEAIAEHIVYVADLIAQELGVDGKRHVGFGADYTHLYEDALQIVVRDPERYSIRAGYGSLTEQALPADVWGVVAVLEEKHGWTDAEVRGFLGGNALRVYEANWLD